MRENVKNMLLGISIFYAIVILSLSLFSLINATDKMTLTDDKENIQKLANYKIKINSLKTSECKNIINEIVLNYEKSSYNGEVSIKKIRDNVMPLTTASKAKEACEITGDEVEETNFNYKFLSLNMPLEEIFENNYFQYELHLKDNQGRNIAEAIVTNLNYQIQRRTQLEIISDLIKYAERMDV